MYDIFFLSYNEPNSEQNYARLLDVAPWADRVHGVTGIHAAHMACAQQSTTDFFFTVDADNWVYDKFEFIPSFEPDPNGVHVYRCKNAVNDLVYGYGAIKLFSTRHLIDVDTTSIDMTTSVTTSYHIVNELVSETRYNTSPFETWKSAFRECVKLSSKTIKNQKDFETEQRLSTWKTMGTDREYGQFSIAGAKAGEQYGIKYCDNQPELAKINDWNWLTEQFKKSDHVYDTIA